jgi:hypothetical protein
MKNDWIKVNSYKDIPLGEYLVWYEEEKPGKSQFGLAKVNRASNSNICIIDGHFAFDNTRNVVAYRPLNDLEPKSLKTNKK